MVKYRFSPTVLDKYFAYLHADEEFESPFNVDSEGCYKRSLEEISDELEQKLLDTINHVKGEPTEAMDAGTCLGEVVDRLVLNQKDGREDVKLWSDEGCVHAQMDDFSFEFSKELCLTLRNYFMGCVPQYHTEAILNTAYGDVALHGYIDYVDMDRIIDLKTTSKYEFGKYADYNQRLVYPYCMVKSGDMDKVHEFEFLAVQWRKRVGQPWEGAINKEVYTIKMDALETELRSRVERFVEWADLHRDQITYKPFLGLEEE